MKSLALLLLSLPPGALLLGQGLPVISSPGSASATAGAPFSYQITATPTPASHAATGLPSGLALNPASGLISGTPATVGTHPITLSATNAAGTSPGFNLLLSVKPALPATFAFATGNEGWRKVDGEYFELNHAPASDATGSGALQVSVGPSANYTSFQLVAPTLVPAEGYGFIRSISFDVKFARGDSTQLDEASFQFNAQGVEGRLGDAPDESPVFLFGDAGDYVSPPNPNYPWFPNYVSLPVGQKQDLGGGWWRFTLIPIGSTYQSGAHSFAGLSLHLWTRDAFSNENALILDNLQIQVADTAAPYAQSIAFEPASGTTLNASPLTLTAAASSGLPVTLEVLSGPATLSGSTLTLTGLGNVSVRARQTGSGIFAPAADVVRTFSVSADTPPSLSGQPLSQTIAVGGSATFTVTAAGSAPLAYQWRKDGVALSGATAATLTLPSAQSSDAGTYTAVVSNAAGSVTSQGATLTVAGVPPPPPPPSQQSQTITFAALAARTFGSAPFALTASATSGLPVAFTVVSGPGSLTGSTLTLTGAGTVVLRATQSGDATYAAAAPVEQSLTVNPAPATVAFGNLSAAFDGSPKPVTVTTVPAGLSVALAYGVAPGSPTAPSAVGSYPVTATVTDPNYTGTASGTLVIAGSLPVVTWTPPAGVPVGTVLGAAQLNATASVPGTFVYAPAAGTLLGTAGVQTLSLTFTPSDPTYATVVTTRSVTVSTALPVLTEQPRSQAVALGGTLALRVGVAASAGLTYRWLRDGVALVAGPRFSGLASAALTVTDFQSGDVGAYTVEVTGGGVTVVSSAAQVSLLPAGYAATHAVPGSVYGPGGTVTVSSTLTFPGQPGLGWSVLLPPGWSYAGGGGTEGDVRPTLGATDLLEWAWTGLPAGPVSFTYTLNVPVGFSGLTDLVALAIFRPSGSGALQVLAQPDPLVLAQFLHHSADTDRNLRLSLLELTRVIELYNTRNGTSRTGAYAVATATSEDGFTPDASRAPTATVSLARHHSADTNRDGRLSLLELTRVIELYNHRSGSARTGDYRVSPGSEDGFAPGP